MLGSYKRQRKKTERHLQKQEAETNRPREMSTKSKIQRKTKIAQDDGQRKKQKNFRRFCLNLQITMQWLWKNWL